MKKRLITSILAGAMILSLAACASEEAPSSQATGGQTSSAGATSTAGDDNKDDTPEEVVTLDLLVPVAAYPVDGYTEKGIQDHLAEELGLRLGIVAADADKFNVILAGGDLPDMVRVNSNYFEQLIVGKNVIAYDDYLAEYGQNITANAPETVAFAKEYYSEGEGKLYFLPVQVGKDMVGQEYSLGPIVRWDLYKELGAPDIKTIDEYLEVLKQMVDLYPENENGDKVYALGTFTDNNDWHLQHPMSAFLGQSGGADIVTNEYTHELDEDGLFWDSVEFYYKANQMGIFDPDSFTQKTADYVAKQTAGRYVSAAAMFHVGTYNAENSEEEKGFIVIPTEFSQQWNGTDFKLGWSGKEIGITSDCEYPEKAVSFVDYCYSYDGARTLYSGVEGVHWEYVDGVPMFTEETMELRESDPDAFGAIGIPFDANHVGMGQTVLHPEDGKPLNLFRSPDLYPDLLTPIQADFSEHYEVDYPSQIFAEYREEYDIADQSGLNVFIPALMPIMPDDIKRIDAKLLDESLKAAARLILAESDEQYNTIKEEVMNTFNDNGLQEIIEWYETEWEIATQKAEELG